MPRGARELIIVLWLSAEYRVQLREAAIREVTRLGRKIFESISLLVIYHKATTCMVIDSSKRLQVLGSSVLLIAVWENRENRGLPMQVADPFFYI